MAKLSPILNELERQVAPLASRYGLLRTLESPPVVVLASKGRKRTTTGWYNPTVWVDGQEDALAFLSGLDSTQRAEQVERRAEVVIPTELLDDPVSTVGELLRQLVVHEKAEAGHLAQVTGQNGYYPIYWEDQARHYDHQAVVLDDQPSRGWAGWSPLPAFREWCKEHVNTEVFDVERINEKAVRKGSRMKKWRCNCTTVRCATKLVATCEMCGVKFGWAERGEEPPWPDAVRLFGEQDIPTAGGA